MLEREESCISFDEDLLQSCLSASRRRLERTFSAELTTPQGENFVGHFEFKMVIQSQKDLIDPLDAPPS